MFFFPSGVKVERQGRHGTLSGGAVKQSTRGKLLEVPVPRNISSIDFDEDSDMCRDSIDKGKCV